MVSKPELIHRFVIAQSGAKRSLAYSDVGDKRSEEILICIPGILETRDTFANLLEKVDEAATCRAVSVDLCGRGDSDPLESSDVYSMKLYLSDLELFLNHVKETHHTKPVKIHLLGTSMGGILAMYLAAGSHNVVTSVILNDVGLSLPWWSIYKLFGTMGKGAFKTAASIDINDIAASLRVSPAAVRAVQDPAHFDLPYKSDLMGMRFANIVQNFKGPISLIHAQDSVICTAMQVDEFQKLYPHGVLEVPDVEHPAPYNSLVCEFVISKIMTPRPAAKMVSDNEVIKAPLVAEPKLKPKSKSTPGSQSRGAVQESADETVPQKVQLQQSLDVHPEQMPLFTNLTIDPIGLEESVHQIAEMSTQIMNQYTQALNVQRIEGLDAPLGAPGRPEPGELEQHKARPVFHRWKSAVTNLFKPK